MGPWLITFLRLRRRINNSVAAPRHRIHHSPASWWACGRPVPRSVGGIWYGTPGLHNVVHSGGSGGSTVRPQRAICHRGLLCCLYLLLLSAYSKSVCSAAALHQQTASSCQSQSLKVSTFLQRHCCCLSQGVKGPRPSFLSTLRAANWKQDMAGVGGVPIS